jgi:hypothetical protein
MIRFLFLLICMLPVWASASLPIQTTLKELAQGADHMLVGTVVDVDMVNERGILVLDPGAMTGPGLNTQIRLHIRVDKVLATNASKVPPILKVGLDPWMHYRLGQVKGAHAGKQPPRLIILKGATFSPVVAGAFLRPLSERRKAMQLFAAKRH